MKTYEEEATGGLGSSHHDHRYYRVWYPVLSVCIVNDLFGKCFTFDRDLSSIQLISSKSGKEKLDPYAFMGRLFTGRFG